jgi:tetratricopeptide (TPR) repeat protein
MLRGVFALGAVVCFLGACALVMALFMVRFVPPRYVARFVPEPLQGYFRSAPVELPTPSAPHVAAALLTPVPLVTRSISQSVTPSASPSATAVISQPTSTPASAPRPTLTLTPVPFPGPTQAARSTPAALDSATVLLTGFRHVFQTWNNCGPANLTMGLSYYGWKGAQADAAAVLKPDPEDRNVNPDEMAAFARSQGFQAMVRVNGTLDLLKALLRAGFPPIVEKGFEPEEKLGWMGHYELVIGWSDATREFIVMDSYLGPNQPVSFDDMDKYWRQFNRTYIVIYKPEQAETLSKIIGGEMDDATMYQNALARAQAELAANDQDAFGWFNLGTNYAALQMFNESVAAYDQARRIGLPWRMTWYQFGWFEAYLAANRLDDVIALADVTLKNDPYAEEMYYYKGLVFQKRGDANAARGQFELALKHNPNFARAKQALGILGP